MEFRHRLVRTLEAVRSVLEEPGVLVVGSEVPNLLEPGAAATLVVSQDVDIAIAVEAHAAVRARLRVPVPRLAGWPWRNCSATDRA